MIIIIIIIIYTIKFLCRYYPSIIPLIPLIIMHASLYMWFQSPLTKVYGPVVLMVHGIILGGICSKFIICSTAIMNFGWLHVEVFVEAAFLIQDLYFKVLPSEVTFFIFCLYAVVNYLTFVIGVVRQLSKYLKISVFLVD